MPGTIPYTKSFYPATSQYLLASTESGTVSATTPLSDFTSSGFERMWDADLPWSIEFDVMIQPGWTGVYNKIFQYKATGMGYFDIYVNYVNEDDIRIKFYVWRDVDNKQYYAQKLFDISDDTHAITNTLTSTGTWLRVSVCKGTGTDIRDTNIIQYVNGYTGTSQNTWGNHTDYDLDDDLGGTDSGGDRYLYLGDGGENVIGMIAFYDKQLSSTEVNENYDDGARAGGSADASKIMVQDLTSTSANSNLTYYNFYDTAVDSDNLMEHKEGAVDLQSINTTLANAASQTVPQVPVLKPSPVPNTIYATESQTFSQPVSGTSGTTVKWYSDAGLTSLLHTGTDYTFTAPSAGAQNLYVSETKTWSSPYGAVAQTIHIPYTSSNAGDSTHSVMVNDGTYAGAASTYRQLISPVLADSDFDVSGGHGKILNVLNSAVAKVSSKTKLQYQKLITLDKDQSGGGFTFTQWHSHDHVYSYHPILRVSDGSGGYWYIKWGGWFTSRPSFQMTNTNGTTTFTPSGSSYYNTTKGQWNCTTFSWDWVNGDWYTWVNGNPLTTYSHANLEDSFLENSSNTFALSMSSNQYGTQAGTPKMVDNLAIYKGVLSNAEVSAISGGTDGDPGDSVDLSGLASYSKCISYWSCGDTDTFSEDSGDHINNVKGGRDIPVADTLAAWKKADRP